MSVISLVDRPLPHVLNSYFVSENVPGCKKAMASSHAVLLHFIFF